MRICYIQARIKNPDSIDYLSSRCKKVDVILDIFYIFESQDINEILNFARKTYKRTGILSGKLVEGDENSTKIYDLELDLIRNYSVDISGKRILLPCMN